MTMGLVDEDAMHGKAMAQRCQLMRIERCISQEHLIVRLYSSSAVFLAIRVVTARCVIESARAGVDQRGPHIAGIELLPECDNGLNSGTST
jgi:hypothetical protein